MKFVSNADFNLPEFTEAERQVMPLMTLPLKVCSHRLGCSESNVKSHFASIRRKLGVMNRECAVAILVRAGVQMELLVYEGCELSAQESPEPEAGKEVSPAESVVALPQPAHDTRAERERQTRRALLRSSITDRFSQDQLRAMHRDGLLPKNFFHMKEAF
ncbi:hypothetical protein BMI86_10110 [Thioclava sp. DLFJ5-1]|uniref:LuxR C-terminal-related transcriptional regulator n=1 Tax=Thioclava sp. DLFJ5-1 TaxID=1915314 RepID=UPI0009C5A0E1|nr:LuxR C-terminal-related transcriptional regulator [Thioclava sp. DLFJ5-1]OOY20851.1 hypothetical protein BMI86_10110 [Thioclava sp. DLFJ5-1]